MLPKSLSFIQKKTTSVGILSVFNTVFILKRKTSVLCYYLTEIVDATSFQSFLDLFITYCIK